MSLGSMKLTRRRLAAGASRRSDRRLPVRYPDVDQRLVAVDVPRLTIPIAGGCRAKV
jgi:hypothetical protein